MAHSLLHPYPAVALPEGALTVGGNQTRLSTQTLRRWGCGAVAMADLVLYLTRYHGVAGPPEAAMDPLPLAAYDRLVRALSLRYLPIVPHMGTNGPALAAGMNLYLMTHHVPMTAVWGIGRRAFWTAMGELLDRDLPVVLAIGPNLPLTGPCPLPLYRRCGKLYTPAGAARGHFVTVLGLDGGWVRVNSWGQEFYIDRRQYQDYARRRSLSLASNLLWFTRTQRFSVFLG